MMKSVAEIVQAGAVGSILKTGHLTEQRGSVISLTPPTAFGRGEAARAAAIPIVISAHTDLYLLNIGDEAARFDETVARQGLSGSWSGLLLSNSCARSPDDRAAGEGARSVYQH
jgi:hypothetical protein